MSRQLRLAVTRCWAVALVALAGAAPARAQVSEAHREEAAVLNADATAASQAGRTSEAIEGFQRAARLDPTRWEYQWNLANALYGAARVEEATEALEAFVRRPDVTGLPQLADARLALATLARAQRDRQRVRQRRAGWSLAGTGVGLGAAALAMVLRSAAIRDDVREELDRTPPEEVIVSSTEVELRRRERRADRLAWAALGTSLAAAGSAAVAAVLFARSRAGAPSVALDATVRRSGLHVRASWSF